PVDGHWILAAQGKQLFFTGIEPEHHYKVVVFKGLTAITDKYLVSDVSESIHTKNLQPFIDFASDGSLIPAGLVKGIPIVAVNVKQVDVDFYRIKPDKISHFLNNWRGHESAISIWRLDDYKEYTDLIHSARFELDPPVNQRYTTHLNIANIKDLDQAGVYLAVMKQAGQYRQYQASYFTISDIGLHAQQLDNELNIYVSSLQTGEAMDGVELSFLDKEGKVLAEVQSDKDGVAQLIKLRDKATVLLAKQGNHLSVLNLQKAALDLSEFAITGQPYHALELFVYGPRDLYRPGEKVHFNALLRNEDGQKVATPPLKAVIKRADGQKIHYFTFQADASGLYRYDFDLPAQTDTGQWKLSIAMPDGKNIDYLFAVEDFLPERMALQLGDAQRSTWVLKDQDLQLDVLGRYLYGAAAEGNRVSSEVGLQAKRHALVQQYKGFLFGDEDESVPYSKGERFAPKDLELNAEGKGQIAIDTKWQVVKNTPVKIALSASLFETGGRAINRFINYTYWPQETLLGIKSSLDLAQLNPDSTLEFEFINAQHNGTLVATEAVLTLIHEQRDYFWEFSGNGNGWRQRYTENNVPVSVEQLSLNADKPTTVKLAVQQGQYLLQIKNTQTGQLSSLRFHVGHRWGDLNAQSARPERVQMQWDKAAYSAGDIARLTLIPPHAGNGFVLLESADKALWFKRVKVPTEGLTLDIPVDKNWQRHDIYANAVVFRAGDAQQKITPNRAVGLLHLKLDREPQRLQLDISTDSPKIRPETTLTTRIKLLNSQTGETVHVTLAAVDVGVLSLSHFTTPDPTRLFWGKKRYAVDQYDVYGNIVELLDAGLSKARFGGDASEDDGTMPRTDVKVVSLFSQPVKFDEHGEAVIELEIPDFNGKLRLMALAYSEQRFGAAENYVTVAAPIIAEAAMPRFLAGGDESTLSVDILNQSGVTQTIHLALQSTAPVLLNSEPQSFVLQDQEKKILKYPLIAQNDFGQARISLQLSTTDSSEAIEINREWGLAVRPAYPAINQVINTQISARQSKLIKPDLNAFLLNSSYASLSLSAQPPMNVVEQLSELLAYPYGCLEQTTSTSYPWLFLNAQRIAQFKLNEVKANGKKLDLTQRTDRINQSIIRLAGMQRGNGSFGLWGNHSDEEHWLTAYVSDFLLDARDAGFSIPEPVINKALARLLKYVSAEGRLYSEPYSAYPEHSRFAFKAYAAYVLSRVNRAPLGSLRTLYQHHREQARSGLPLVHLGLALIKQGDTKRGQLAIQQGLKTKRVERVYLADYGSRLRDLSLMTYLLNKHHAQGAESLIFRLSGLLASRVYLSTQERNALFLVAVELAGNKASWSANLVLNTIKQVLNQDKAYQERFKAAAIPSEISVQSTHDKALFMQLRLKGYPQKVPAVDKSVFSTQRKYYTLAGQAIDLAALKVGDLVLVHLQVKANERIKQGLVVDLLPAGFEIENQNLDNSLSLSDLAIELEGESIARIMDHTYFDYQQYRDDRYVAALDMQAERVNDLFYLVRMVTPGVYTIPPVYVEDMYRPYLRGIGQSGAKAKISQK
ncbi:MAG: alpha-2-macroglobulin family protein, partial [Methyloprofundus sp.]|nr:alpha-2-macroglobulin family protein [Methyloprofundus sp.]